MGISLKHLEYVIAVAEHLNFHQAADRCHVTQATLSVQIKKFEGYVGVTVFHRDRHHVEITRIGAEVIEQARTALQAAERIQAIGRRPTSGD